MEDAEHDESSGVEFRYYICDKVRGVRCKKAYKTHLGASRRAMLLSIERGYDHYWVIKKPLKEEI